MSEPVIGVEAAEHIVAQWQARALKAEAECTELRSELAQVAPAQYQAEAARLKAEAAHEILHAMMEAAQDMMGQAQDERDATILDRNKLQNLFVNAVDGREKAEEALREILARLEECPCTDATEPFVVEMQNIARAALVELPTDFPEEARIRFNDLSEKGE